MLSFSWWTSSSLVRLRILSVSMFLSNYKFQIANLNVPFARYELGTQRKLVRRQTHGFHGIDARDAFHLEQDAARLDHGDPVIRSALSLTHTGFSRLLRNRLVREHPVPHLPAPLAETRHGDACRFNLTACNPAAPHCLESVRGESETGTSPGLSG